MNKNKLVGIRLNVDTLNTLKKDFGSVQNALRYLITSYLIQKKEIK